MWKSRIKNGFILIGETWECLKKRTEFEGIRVNATSAQHDWETGKRRASKKRVS